MGFLFEGFFGKMMVLREIVCYHGGSVRRTVIWRKCNMYAQNAGAGIMRVTSFGYRWEFCQDF